jgi:hypothetical protein
MFEPVAASVFVNAALPQKIVLLALVGSVPFIAVATVLAYRDKEANSAWARVIADARIAGPIIGLLVGAMNSVHMGQTIMRVSFAPTAKQLAPGLLEVATLIGLGALVGMVALVAHCVLRLRSARNQC